MRASQARSTHRERARPVAGGENDETARDSTPGHGRTEKSQLCPVSSASRRSGPSIRAGTNPKAPPKPWGLLRPVLTCARRPLAPVISLGPLRTNWPASELLPTRRRRFVDGLGHPVPHPEPVAGCRLPLRRREAAPGRQGVLPPHVVGGSGGGAGGVRGEAAAVR